MCLLCTLRMVALQTWWGSAEDLQCPPGSIWMPLRHTLSAFRSVPVGYPHPTIAVRPITRIFAMRPLTMPRTAYRHTNQYRAAALVPHNSVRIYTWSSLFSIYDGADAGVRKVKRLRSPQRFALYILTTHVLFLNDPRTNFLLFYLITVARASES